MLGGGNPAGGANPAGIGTSLNYVRTEDRTLAYAYSGPVVVNNTTATALEFTSGTNVIVGEVQLTGVIADMGSN